MRGMMRQLEWRGILMGALFMLGGATSAWAQNIFPATGNVGIGTTSPESKLVIFNNSPDADAELVLWDTQTVGDVQSTIAIREDLINDKAGRFVYNNSGNSGLFLTNLPNSALLISGGGATNGLVIVGGAGPIRFGTGGMALTDERMRIDTAGNVGIGTTAPAAKLHVAGDAHVDGILTARFQDVAEWVQTTRPLASGTVVVVDPQKRNQVLPASQSYDTRVAGIVSDRPGLLLGEAGQGKVKVAQIGRVKVKVDASYGSIVMGDLLVTSPTPGHAMRSTPLNLGGAVIHRPGTLLGKALEPLAEGQGEILVLLTLQ